MSGVLSVPGVDDTRRVELERRSQQLAIAFVASGIFFMLLPGTFLGVWNLIGISQHRMLETISAAWLQAHGRAQIFGWIGSFILGIGFYSLTKMQSTRAFPVRAAWASWALWTLGVSLRWIGGVTAWHWRILLPVSGALQLAGFLFFFVTVRRCGPGSTGQRMDLWLRLVSAGTFAFLVTEIVNLIVLTQLALEGSAPALPHVLDEQMVVLAIWGILVPTIWGFNARWLPIFAGFKKPSGAMLAIAYALSVAGLIAAFLNLLSISAAAFFLSALAAIDGLKVWQRPVQPAKLLNVHRTFPFFIRGAYVWLVVSCVLGGLAVLYDRDGGIWGASRHALTVGFVAAMAFVIGPRILPAFCGMRVLWSTRLMFWSLLLLHAGCLLRVAMEPLAYEGYWAFAWKLLPVSAVVELAAVVLFAVNIAGTLLRQPAHLLTRIRTTA